MIVLHLFPLVAALGPVAVGVAKRRPWDAVVGLAIFDVGYLAILLAENDGANSWWHLVWLLGLGLLPWGVVPRPEAGSWWADRYGYGTIALGICAALPVTATALAFLLPFIPPLQGLLHPLVPVPLLDVAVLGPILGGLGGWVNKNRTWRTWAVMSGANGLVLASVVVAYVTGAFVFGF